jgi:hypothetical protein
MSDLDFSPYAKNELLGKANLQAEVAGEIRAALNPGEVPDPGDFEEAKAAALKLPDGKPDEAAQAALRSKHEQKELAYSEYLLSKKWPNPCTVQELQYLARAATKQLREAGYIRG